MGNTRSSSDTGTPVFLVAVAIQVEFLVAVEKETAVEETVAGLVVLDLLEALTVDSLGGRCTRRNTTTRNRQEKIRRESSMVCPPLR